MPEIRKVTDPNKIVTDPVLLSALARAGIDRNYVEFYQDYASAYVNGKKVKGQSPYAKFYRDLKSGKRFMVVSGLPMVDADGNRIEAGWRIAGINYFAEKNNLFRAKVQCTQVEITIKNDQPDGRKAGDKLTFKPQLYLNNIEQPCKQSTLLPIDPVNSNYVENTLEWDYGICKRRLRIIEGRLLGAWVFAGKSSGIVRIKYNQTGDYRLRLGQFAINDDEEQITPDQCDELARFQGGYPVTISDSTTFYPDADPETSSVDGNFYQSYGGGEGVTWATIIGLTSSISTDAGAAAAVGFISDYVSYRWRRCYRSIVLFDTSSLPDNAIKQSAVLSLFGESKVDTGSFSPDTNIYSSSPASNTDLVDEDYDQVGSTPLSTAIAYGNWKIADPFWNDFNLNPDGLAAILVTGISKFSVRNATNDAGATSPTWIASKTGYTWHYQSEQGAGYKPKLVVTYEAGVDVTIEAVLATINSEGKVPSMSLGRTMLSPLVSFNGQGLVPGLVRDRIFSVPISLVDSAGKVPSLVRDRIFASPLVSVDSAGLNPSLSLGRTLQIPLVDSSLVTPTPSLVLDRIFSAPLVAIDAEALAAIIRIEQYIPVPLTAIDSEALAGSLRLDRIFSAPLVAIDAEALVAVLSISPEVLLPPVVAMDSEAKVPGLSLGVVLLAPKGVIDSQGLVPGLVLDRIFSAPLVAIDAEALAGSLRLDRIFSAPLTSIYGQVSIPVLYIRNKRVLAVQVITGQYRKVKPITSQYRKIKTVTL